MKSTLSPLDPFVWLNSFVLSPTFASLYLPSLPAHLHPQILRVELILRVSSLAIPVRSQQERRSRADLGEDELPFESGEGRDGSELGLVGRRTRGVLFGSEVAVAKLQDPGFQDWEVWMLLCGGSAAALLRRSTRRTGSGDGGGERVEEDEATFKVSREIVWNCEVDRSQSALFEVVPGSAEADAWELRRARSLGISTSEVSAKFETATRGELSEQRA